MKVCSVCLKCYDDSDAICAVDEDHGALTKARKGNCLVFENYRIESRFESDSPVELFKATHLASKKSVVLRFIERDHSVSGLEKELEAYVCLEHPNLARVFEFGETFENEFFVALEDVAGRNFRDQLDESAPLSERKAITIVRQTSEGLEALHAAGLVHRAVNPSNIYFEETEDGALSVKLHNFDFGGLTGKAIARKEDSAGDNTDLPAYFSPEQHDDRKTDFRSDIYSLAVVFYESLLGRLPFDPMDEPAMSDYVFNESDVWNLHIDLRALLAHILRQSFQKRLELRPPTTNNFLSQLRYLELIANRNSKIGSVPCAATVNEIAPALEPSHLSEESKPELYEPVVSENDSSGEVAVFLGSIDSAETEEKVADAITHISLDQMPETAALTYESIDREEPIELSSGPSMLADPVHVKTAGTRPKSNACGVMVYIAGLLISAVFGGAVTSSFLEWQGTAETPIPAKSVAVPADPRQDIYPENSPEFASEDAVAADAPEDDDSYENARDLDQVVTLVASEGGFGEKSVSQVSSSRQDEKRKAKRDYNRKSDKSKNGKKSKNAEKTTRPGVFEDIIIYY